MFPKIKYISELKWLVLQLFLFPFALFGQNEKFIPTATLEGMADLTVTSIVQDDYGYMWFGTKDGLHIYDGYQFVILTSDPADSSTISGNVILCLEKDDQGNIWAGTESNGLNKIDPVTHQVKRFYKDAEDPSSLLSNQIYALEYSSDGRLWVGTYDKGFCIYEKGTFEHYPHLPDDPTSVSQGPIWNIMEDSGGQIWISTWGGGLDLFDPDEETFSHYRHDPQDEYSISSNMAGPTYEDKSGNIWVTTWQDGLNKLDPKTGKFEHFSKNGPPNKKISNNVLWPVLGSKDDRLWVGTYSAGLDLLDPKTGELINYHYDPEFPRKFLHNNIWSLYYDRSNVLWIGTEGGGVMRYGGISKPFKTIKPKLKVGNQTSSEIIRSVTSDQNGFIWIGSWFNGLIRYQPETGELKPYFRNSGEPNAVGINQIRALFTDKEGMIWVGSNREGVYRLDPETDEFMDLVHEPDNENSISHNNIRSITQDAQGKIWIGTIKGLNSYDPATGKIERFITDPSDSTSIPNDHVNVVYKGRGNLLWIGSDFGLIKYDLRSKEFEQISNEGDLMHAAIQSLHEDREGIIWIGTKNGLNYYNPETERFSFFKINSIPAHNIINSIQEDERNNLWLGTNFGILKLDKTRESISYFDQSEGVEILNYSYGASCKTFDGHLYFGGIGGLTSLQPDDIEINERPPRMLIERVQIEGEPYAHQADHISLVKKLEIDYLSSNFSIQYIGFSYLKPEKTRYAYKLEGYETDWNHVGGERVARYSGVPAGEYLFKVKASNEDGIWSDEATIAIVIPVPYWQKWWFYLIVALGLVTLIFVIIKWRLRKLEREKKLLESRILQATEDLRAKNQEIERQHTELEETHREITDSIAYAKRIQHAILPPDSLIDQYLPENFVLYKPKDVVAGDFYWMEHTGDVVLFAAADCTGHGVPGAMVSVVCNNALNRAVREYGIKSPAKILDKTREIVIEEFDQGDEDVKDGMDISLCSLNLKTGRLEWAGANNPLWLIKKGAQHVEEIKGNKQPIGKYAEETLFTNHDLQLSEGDTIYIFSDGYPDQFGGDKGKKFKSGNLKKTFLAITEHPMKKQREMLNARFEQWRGDFEQIDDVCVIGVRF